MDGWKTFCGGTYWRLKCRTHERVTFLQIFSHVIYDSLYGRDSTRKACWVVYVLRLIHVGYLSGSKLCVLWQVFLWSASRFWFRWSKCFLLVLLQPRCAWAKTNESLCHTSKLGCTKLTLSLAMPEGQRTITFTARHGICTWYFFSFCVTVSDIYKNPKTTLIRILTWLI